MSENSRKGKAKPFPGVLCPWSGRVEALHPSVQALSHWKSPAASAASGAGDTNSLFLKLTQVLVWGDCLPFFFFFFNTHISACISEQQLGLV